MVCILALRVGNKKVSMRQIPLAAVPYSVNMSHSKFESPNFAIFDFLGKDVIWYYNTVTVDEQVFKNIKIFERDK